MPNPPTQQRALGEAELLELERLLDAVPKPLEPLDVTMLDGFLCGVLLQPQPVPEAQWWPFVLDIEGRPAPVRFAQERLRLLAWQRHAELERAIAQRQWFDPWVFELDEDAQPLEAVLPWVAGFSVAMDQFPALMQDPGLEVLEPLAVLYAAFDPDDLEDAEALLEVIETLEPPQDMTEAVEGLVSSVMLLADVTRPPAAPPRTSRPLPSPAVAPRQGPGRPGSRHRR